MGYLPGKIGKFTTLYCIIFYKLFLTVPIENIHMNFMQNAELYRKSSWKPFGNIHDYIPLEFSFGYNLNYHHQQYHGSFSYSFLNSFTENFNIFFNS